MDVAATPALGLWVSSPCFSALPGGDNNGGVLVQAFGHGRRVISGRVPHGFDEFSQARDSSLAGEHAEGVAARQSRPLAVGVPSGHLLPATRSVRVGVVRPDVGWLAQVRVSASLNNI